MQDHDGLLTEVDFAGYVAKTREPLRTTYRGFEIVGFPPSSSGGVHVAQILNILEKFDLKALGANSPDFIHVVAEAMKLAFADRAFWLGDPDFVPVPRGLLDKGYAAQLAKKIRLEKITPVPQHSIPPRAAQDLFKKHTTHFSAADSDGNWVACTATINTSFGSKIVVPGTGVVLNNEMDDFSAQPGMANFFGLVGAEANGVAPGKRPLSSMSPTIVLKNGKPILSLGAAGGPTIITQTLLAIIHVADFGRDPADALAQPRFHHQWSPDELRIEKRFPAETRRELERRGHKLREVDSFGACQIVGRAGDGEAFVGAADPRVSDGSADGW
jgi:gamma-glutamyltranspeptidase/glutathione hydrolase